MNHKLFKRLVAVLMASILLLGTLSGAMPVAAAGEFSAAFANDYAEVGVPMTLVTRSKDPALFTSSRRLEIDQYYECEKMFEEAFFAQK